MQGLDHTDVSDRATCFNDELETDRPLDPRIKWSAGVKGVCTLECRRKRYANLGRSMSVLTERLVSRRKADYAQVPELDAATAGRFKSDVTGKFVKIPNSGH